MPFLDIVLTGYAINGSQQRQYLLYFKSEYFIDQEKYFYIIFWHSNTVVCVGTIATVGTGTMLRGYLIHACGLFKIAR